jgi:hypothetical protein
MNDVNNIAKKIEINKTENIFHKLISVDPKTFVMAILAADIGLHKHPSVAATTLNTNGFSGFILAF